MSIVDHYKRQWPWRDWPTIFDALPPIEGNVVLDIGCGVGDQAAELVRRGARVIGLEIIEDVVAAARARELPNAEFRLVDLRKPLDLTEGFDGVWCSFTAAYFPNLGVALANWTANLRPGGWVAMIEIDDFFGHEPVSPRTRALFESYYRESLETERYDFLMGRKLGEHLNRCGFTVRQVLTPFDKELAFDGPAHPDVIDAWRTRLDWMKFLREHCGAEFEALRDDFLGCLAQAEHRSLCKVYCVIATKYGFRPTMRADDGELD